MLITNLLPLLARYSLGFDLIAGPDGLVTLTVIPRKAVGAKHEIAGGEVRPISITATATEIDSELSKGSDGALGQLIYTRKALADQIADQREAAEVAKVKAKPAVVTPKITAPAPALTPTPIPAPATVVPGDPASLW
jgi:PRTRC genetic system protein E